MVHCNGDAVANDDYATKYRWRDGEAHENTSL